MSRFYDFKKFRFLPFYARVENLLVSNYWSGDDGKVVPNYFEGTPFAGFKIYEVSKNHYYGKEGEYILEESGFYRSSTEYGVKISPECFKNREVRAVIGEFLEINNDELVHSLNLNERIFDLTDEEKLTVLSLAKAASSFICEQLRNNIEEDDYDE